MTLFGCSETPIREVVLGSRELPQTRGRVTAREALAHVYPAVLEISKKPILLLITSGSDIGAEGRSGTWEFVFHFPARFAQGVYSLEPRDPEGSDSGSLDNGVVWEAVCNPLCGVDSLKSLVGGVSPNRAI
jgi:hypothetical protein